MSAQRMAVSLRSTLVPNLTLMALGYESVKLSGS
jgi:hypothetical protein